MAKDKAKKPPKRTGEKASAEGRCMKCKKTVAFDGEVVIWSNGMRVATGKCPTCGTGVNRILGKA